MGEILTIGAPGCYNAHILNMRSYDFYEVKTLNAYELLNVAPTASRDEIREAYRAAEPMLPIGIDVVVVARSILPEQSSGILTERFCTAGVRHFNGVSSGEIPCTPNQPHKKSRGKKPAAKQS